jgi:hypothetical protein
MEARHANRVTGEGDVTVSRETWIGIAVTVLALVAMAVDHLMGDDRGLEDPPTFLVASGLSLALAAFLVLAGRLAGTGRAERKGGEGWRGDAFPGTAPSR